MIPKPSATHRYADLVGELVSSLTNDGASVDFARAELNRTTDAFYPPADVKRRMEALIAKLGDFARQKYGPALLHAFGAPHVLGDPKVPWILSMSDGTPWIVRCATEPELVLAEMLALLPTEWEHGSTEATRADAVAEKQQALDAAIGRLDECMEAAIAVGIKVPGQEAFERRRREQARERELQAIRLELAPERARRQAEIDAENANLRRLNDSGQPRSTVVPSEYVSGATRKLD